MGKGKDYELEIKNAIMENTTEEVVALRPDFSGNSLHSVADVVVIWPPRAGKPFKAAFVEMKKRSGQAGYRIRIMEGSSKGESGLDELEGLIDGTPPWGKPWVMVKFDHREAIVENARDIRTALDDNRDDCHGARLTPADSISMVKPELDDWPSATAGEDDWRKLLDAIGVPSEFIIGGIDVNVDVDSAEATA